MQLRPPHGRLHNAIQISFIRTFTTTIRLTRQPRTTVAHLLPAGVSTQDIPPYPHGEYQWYKQSNNGLYGGARIQFGNNVSKKTETKTRRTWHPNVQFHNLFSLALNRMIRVKVTTRVLRTIDKVGGLDEYLLGKSRSRIKELGPTGWKLRWAIMMSPSGKKRIRNERLAMGLPAVAETEGLSRHSKLTETPEMLQKFVQKRYEYGLPAPGDPKIGKPRILPHEDSAELIEESSSLPSSHREQFMGEAETVEVEKPSLGLRFLRAIRLRR